MSATEVESVEICGKSLLNVILFIHLFIYVNKALITNTNFYVCTQTLILASPMSAMSKELLAAI